MSYLNSLRLHFAGKFQAAPSTVNNDPQHYNNQTFIPSYQEFGNGTTNGWWNPSGDAAWRLTGCRVTGAWMNHAPVPKSDPILSWLIADSDRTVSAKLVDLDPEQQTVSEIWGMMVRICTQDGTSHLVSRYKTAPFIDLWSRAPGGSDITAGAAYQSVLHDLEWSDIGASPFLHALREASGKSGKLSIKFNVDGYNMTMGTPDFTFGRVVGTIGPCSVEEPDHVVIGRHFMAFPAQQTPFSLNYCPATVDAQAGKIYLDLGNAMPTTVTRGPVQSIGTLSLSYVDSKPEPIENIDYLTPQWYENTAGVVEVPAARTLTAAELAGVQANPLQLTGVDSTGTLQASIAEPGDGLYVRADQFVYRLQPDEKAEVPVYATQFGVPLAGARVISIFDPLQLQPGNPPNVATPDSALDFPSRIVTGRDGKALLRLHASDPGNPRGYVDGQVYGIRPVIEETLAVGANYPFNPVDFISVLVFNAFEPDHPPTWYGSMQPIFEQYANLYPVMKRFLDMKDYDSVCENVKLLLLAFKLPLEDPNSMPVTRDLSTAKRATIVRWLSEPGADGKPRKGEPRPAPAAEKAAAPETAPPAGPTRGGKTEALARRLVLQHQKSMPM